MKTIDIINSHTGGEPTRLVIAGGPDLGAGTLAQRLRVFCERFDDWRRAIVTEPRGSDVVGALLCEPDDPGAAAGVIFFNNVGYLGMCGHCTIELVASLAYTKTKANRGGAASHRYAGRTGQRHAQCRRWRQRAQRTGVPAPALGDDGGARPRFLHRRCRVGRQLVSSSRNTAANSCQHASRN